MKFQGIFQNQRLLRAFVLTCVVSIALVLVNFLVIGGVEFYSLVNSLTPSVAALVTFFLFLRARAIVKDAVSRRVWLSMALGFGLWGLADSIYAFYTIVLNQPLPYPSIADWIWMAGYLPLFDALIVRMRTLKLVPTQRQRWLMVVLSLLVSALTLFFILIPILQDYDPQWLLAGLVNAFYPLADLGLLVLSIRILILLREGRFTLSWRLIFASILLMTFSDLLFAYGTWQGVFSDLDRVDLLTIFSDTTYSLAYFSAAFGIFVYQETWAIREAFKITFKTTPTANYFAVLSTDATNRITSFSNNLYWLVDAPLDAAFANRPLSEVFGISEQAVQALIEKLAARHLICHEPLRITTRLGEDRLVWATVSYFDQFDYSSAGAIFVLSAAIYAPDSLRQPRDAEQRVLLSHLLSLAGARPTDEIEAMKSYFLEVLRLFSSLVYQFGGEQYKNAFFAALETVIHRNGLSLKISESEVILAQEYDGETLAALLRPLLQAGHSFVGDLMGELMVAEDAQALEQQLPPEAMKVLDKYHLRVSEGLQAAVIL